MDSVKKVITRAVIKDDIGRLKVRQCHPKITNERVRSQHIIAFQNKTIGDILQKRLMQQRLASLVLFHKT